MLRTVSATIFFIFSCLIVFAQNTGTISGVVTDSVQRPLEGATVLLVTGPKDAPVKSALSDDKGAFVFEKVKFGTYKLVISMTGFARYTGAAIIVNEEKNNINTGTAKLGVLSQNLQGVTVTAQRPMVERKIDRTVVYALSVDIILMNRWYFIDEWFIDPNEMLGFTKTVIYLWRASRNLPYL